MKIGSFLSPSVLDAPIIQSVADEVALRIAGDNALDAKITQAQATADEAIADIQFKSYGHQLVRNFNGYTKDNSNFIPWTVDKTQAAKMAVPVVFKRTDYTSSLSNDIIPISSKRKYKISLDMMVEGAEWATNQRMYFQTSFFDADNKSISYATQLTTSATGADADKYSAYLTKVPIAGDTVLECEPLYIRKNDAVGDRAGVALGNYTTDSGVKFVGKELLYSRDYPAQGSEPTYLAPYNIDWDATVADTTNNSIDPTVHECTKIHLKRPIIAGERITTESIDPNDPERSLIFTWGYGGTFVYVNSGAVVDGITTMEDFSGVNDAYKLPASEVGNWHNYSWDLDMSNGFKWLAGTAPVGIAGIKIAGLFNHQKPNSTTYVTNVMVEEVK